MAFVPGTPSDPNYKQPAAPAAPAAPAPASSPSMTLDQIRQLAANPSQIQSGGLGMANNLPGVFAALKQAVQSGQLPLTEYQSLAGAIAKPANQLIGSISRGGNEAADSVKGAWNQLNGTYLDGNGKALAPFSQQELASLPQNVLPTQGDIDSGKFDSTGYPLQRVQSTPGAPTDVQAPDMAGNNPNTVIGHQTKNAQVNGAPIYSANPNNPGPNGGLKTDNSAGGVDAGQIANEGALQQQLATQSQQGITAQRQKYLSDLTDLLNQNTQKQMSEATPGILEDLNSRGLLRSTGTGDALAVKAKSLQADTANQLAQQGIAGETADLGNYTNIQNNYDQSRNSALQRQFSVEDYNNQLQAGKELGAQYASLQPQAPSTKNQVEVAAAGGAAQAGASKAAKSDVELKENIMTADELAAEFMNTLSPIAYNYKDEKHGRGKFLGISAQDMERSFIGRDIVEDAKDGKQLNPWKLVSAMVGCIAHLNARIQSLERGK